MEIVFKLIAAAASIATICNVIFTIKINRKVKKVEEEINKYVYSLIFYCFTKCKVLDPIPKKEVKTW